MSDYAELVKGLRDCSRRNTRVCMICGAKASNLCEGTKSKRMFYAADAIEELLKENGELENSGRVLMAAFARLKEKVPHWISVEERMPDVEQSVLTCAFGRSVGEGTYRGHNGFHHVWKMDAVAGTYWDDEVTHWMPLPEPPKEDAK